MTTTIITSLGQQRSPCPGGSGWRRRRRIAGSALWSAPPDYHNHDDMMIMMIQQRQKQKKTETEKDRHLNIEQTRPTSISSRWPLQWCVARWPILAHLRFLPSLFWSPGLTIDAFSKTISTSKHVIINGADDHRGRRRRGSNSGRRHAKSRVGSREVKSLAGVAQRPVFELQFLAHTCGDLILS